MKVLFVCTQNVGRSQMAAALYNTLSQDGHADAVGTKVDEPGQTIGERAKASQGAWNVLSVMNEIGMDLYHRKRRKLTEAMLDEYDQIIVMAEPETIPKYLHNHTRALYWDIPDPRLRGIDATRETRDELKRKVVDLTLVRR
jgi:arsenate reductase (thioredoxin)